MYSVLTIPYGCLNVQNVIPFEITLGRIFQAPLKHNSLLFFSCIFFKKIFFQCYLSTIHLSAEQQQVYKGDLK